MIDNKTIRFGDGDILVTPVVKKDLSMGAIVLQNQSPQIIGSYSRNFHTTSEDVTLSFSNTESLNVVIERLIRLRGMMIGDYEGTDCDESINF